MTSINKFDFSKIQGKRIKKVYLHYVQPEFNIVFILLDDNSILEVYGSNFSETLDISISNLDRLSDFDDDNPLHEYYPFTCFYENELLEVVLMGERCNGHGIELYFKGIQTKTLIIQSIYSGDKPSDWHDCLRLGIGTYSYTLEDSFEFSSVKEIIDKWDPLDFLQNELKVNYDIQSRKIYSCCLSSENVFKLSEGIYNIFRNYIPTIKADECLDVAQQIWGTKRV